MAFELKPLPYPSDALEPHIDARTMEIHHGKHHATYVTNLNNALKDQAELSNLSLSDLVAHLDKVPENIRTAVRNNGGGHWNHDLFWKLMTPGGSDTPTGELAKAIDTAFGSFDEFKIKFKTAGLGRRIRVGMARCSERRRPYDHFDSQPGQSAHGRKARHSRMRCMGACLLPELPKPPR